MGDILKHPTSEPYGEPSRGDGGSGSGFEARLRSVELDIREIKTDLKHVATRAWVLGGVLAAAGVGAGVALAVIRLSIE